jgi:hypothetical protein
VNQIIERQESKFAALIGGLFGLWFIGVSNVLPWKLNWLVNKTDGSAQQLVFEFYRQTPIIQWPPLAVPNYIRGANSVSPIGSGLIEFPLKIVGKFIPGNFQYLGLWVVACFCLQAYFGTRLLSRFIAERHIRLIGSVFFITAPVLVYRIGAGNHFQLGAHWLILAAFCLYFENELRTRNWLLLLLGAIFINIYISAMVTGIFVACIARWMLEKDARKNRQLLLRSIFYPLLGLAFGFLLMGYMSYGSNSAGTGNFRLNVISFFNPDFKPGGIFSLFASTYLKDLDRAFLGFEGEGFAYVGFGIILGLVAVIFMLTKYLRLRLIQSTGPLFVVCFLMFLFAVSNHPAIARREYSYWWPGSIESLKAIFRATTRFGWPLYYLMMAAVLIAVAKVLSKRWNTAAIALLLVIQMIDIGPSIHHLHQDVSSSSTYRSMQTDPRWKVLAKSHSNIDLYPNFDLQLDESPTNIMKWDKSWFSFCQFAVDNHLTINSGLSARPLGEFPHRDNRRMFYELSTGKLDKETIYVIALEDDWSLFKQQLGSNAFVEEIDGFFVIAAQE